MTAFAPTASDHISDRIETLENMRSDGAQLSQRRAAAINDQIHHLASAQYRAQILERALAGLQDAPAHAMHDQMALAWSRAINAPDLPQGARGINLLPYPYDSRLDHFTIAVTQHDLRDFTLRMTIADGYSSSSCGVVTLKLRGATFSTIAAKIIPAIERKLTRMTPPVIGA